jgi:hypothetical protein
MGRLAAAGRNNARAISDLQTIGDLLAAPVPARLRRALARVAAARGFETTTTIAFQVR